MTLSALASAAFAGVRVERGELSLDGTHEATREAARRAVVVWDSAMFRKRMIGT
jgi:hypothetical protein